MRKMKAEKDNHKERSVSTYLLAMIFSVFMTAGRSFAKSNEWNIISILGNKSLCLVMLLQLAGWFLVSYLLILFFFDFLLKYDFFEKEDIPFTSSKMLRRYWAFLDKKAGTTVFVTLIAVNVPNAILTYPVKFTGDAITQFWQFDTIPLYTHHPVFHTLLLKMFFRVGEYINNMNVGFFLYGIMQALFLILVISFVWGGVLLKLNVQKKVLMMMLLYYSIHPKIAAYLFITTKDTYYAAFFLLFYTLLYMVFFQNNKAEKKWYILFAVSIIGMIAFRNEGKYIVTATMLSCLLLKNVRRRAGLYLAEIVLVIFVINNVFYPILNVGTSKYAMAEMLSIPFQQTARYVRDAGEDVTEEEKKAIDAVLDYDSLAESYNPDISDFVKRTYRGDNSFLKNYFHVWVKMFFKHPEIYFQATMNNYYQYFYWGSKFTEYYSYGYSRNCMENINAALGTDLAYPDSLNILRSELESLREDIFKLPILDLIQTPALYTWIILALLFFGIRERSRKGIVFLVPALIHILVLVSGPTNGYYARYQIPMVVYLPMIVIFFIKVIRSDCGLGKDGLL